VLVSKYHQEQLRDLLEHLREGFGLLDSGEIDEFELDELVHRYKQAAKQLWLFCGSSDGERLQAVSALASMRARGEERDWWAESSRRRNQT
jgi:hypothetical protein